MTGAMLVGDDVEILAQTALGASSIPALRQLQVERDGDSLVLSGRVATFYFKQLAQEIVRGSARGMTVVNQIEVT